MIVNLSWQQALAWRMGRHHLVDRAGREDLLAVVERLCGLHGQVLSAVELALWARVDGLDRTDLQDALWEQRTLVKLWAMRRTLHVFATRDLGLWIAGLRGDDRPHLKSWMEPSDLYAATDLVGKLLDGKLLTRAELVEQVERAGSKPLVDYVAGNWGGAALKRASFQGRLCFAPSLGPQVRFTNPAGWIDGGVTVPAPGAARLEIARRYLTAYAPATAGELGGWFGGAGRHGAQLLTELGDEVVQVELDGKSYWILARDLAELASTQPKNVARLLPGFDQWVVGSSCRLPAMLDQVHRPRVRRMQGWISPVLLVNGKIVGVWKQQRKGNRLLVELEPFGRLPKWAVSKLEAEAVRLSSFLGGSLELTWRP